jgi:hypothetical protein
MNKDIVTSLRAAVDLLHRQMPCALSDEDLRYVMSTPTESERGPAMSTLPTTLIPEPAARLHIGPDSVTRIRVCSMCQNFASNWEGYFCRLGLPKRLPVDANAAPPDWCPLPRMGAAAQAHWDALQALAAAPTHPQPQETAHEI